MIGQNTERTGDGVVPARSEDRLLLDEANHRVANEVAAALAALHLARRAKSGTVRHRMLDLAIERLDGFGECCRLFAAAPTAVIDAGPLLEGVCRALVRARFSSGPSRVILDICQAHVEGDTARRIAMVAHELVTNALKHAFPVHQGELEIRLERLAGDLVLSVIDDGPGLIRDHVTSTGGTGLGESIVTQLVRGCGGTMECQTGPQGTAIHVMVPAGPTIGHRCTADV